MPGDRPILEEDAARYLAHVAGHGLEEDTRWLIEVGRFPVGCAVLDVGCGSGALVGALAQEQAFARSVVGVEASRRLADHAAATAGVAGAAIVHADFLGWAPAPGWAPDTVVMSYYLHHCGEPLAHLRHAAALLRHGGRLYVLDRIAVDAAARCAFGAYWDSEYRAAHEWAEEMPQLLTMGELEHLAGEAGFEVIEATRCPHDRRPRTEGFPKALVELWRRSPALTYPAILLVSPAHRRQVGEIRAALAEVGLSVAAQAEVHYTDRLIGDLYPRCPWREALAAFVGDACEDRTATALVVAGDPRDPAPLQALRRFKAASRARWPSVEGPIQVDRTRAIIHPFHVPEPYEAEAAAAALGLGARVQP